MIKNKSKEWFNKAKEMCSRFPKPSPRAMLLTVGLMCIAYSLTGKSDDYLRARVVKISNERKGMCSGEQVRAPSGQDYILTAAHCRPLETDGSMMITTEDGKTLMRKIIAEDDKSDLLLIEGIPNLEGLSIANDGYLKQHVRSFTHGNNFATWKSDGVLVDVKKIQFVINYIETPEEEAKCNSPKSEVQSIQTFFGMEIKVCVSNFYEVASTVFIVPGSSGGPIVNDDGELVAVVSASDGRGFTYFVLPADVRSFLHNY